MDWVFLALKILVCWTLLSFMLAGLWALFRSRQDQARLREGSLILVSFEAAAAEDAAMARAREALDS